MGKAVVGTCDYDDCPFVGDVQQVHVVLGDREWGGDLCPEHLAPLEQLVVATRRSTRRGQSRNRVWTIEEIERLKSEGT